MLSDESEDGISIDNIPVSKFALDVLIRAVRVLKLIFYIIALYSSRP